MSRLSISNFLSPTNIVLGHDAHNCLPDILAKAGFNRVMLIVDPALAKGVLAMRVTKLLSAAAIHVETFDKVEPDPSDTTVETAYRICLSAESQAIVAIGGGSTIDVAKAVAILATNGGRIHDYEGIDKFSVRPLAVFAVPTTAGTGSEVSGACVVTDTTRHVKMAIRHASLCPPQVAILDPLAVSSLPAHVAAHAAMDAFVHAFESYVSKLANPITDGANLQAMRLIASSIRPFVANRQNSDAAMDMLCGSAMAAFSFGVTGVGNVHCMALPIGALFGVPHGLANSLCLPAVAEFNLIACPARFAHVAEILGADVRGKSEIEAARMAVQAIRELCRDLGIPQGLRHVGVKEDALDEMARRSYAADYNRWNPRHTTEDDFRRLFRAAY